MAGLPAYLVANLDLVLRLAAQHLAIVLVSAAVAVALALPAGIAVTRPAWRRHQGAILQLATVAQTVPSLAVIGLASALFALIRLGIGWWPTLTALVLYSVLPVLANTIAGLQGVDPAVIRAARAMGLTARQVLVRVELPLALPVILGGIRTAVVLNVGTAALAAAIGADCLGSLIFQGIATGNVTILLAGALPTMLLALLLDAAIALLFRRAGRGRVADISRERVA